MDFASRICLKCRKTGHLPANCANERDWQGARDPFGWFFSPHRIDFVNSQRLATSSICERCQALDIPQMLRNPVPWSSSQEMVRQYEQGSDSIHDLGEVSTTEFLATCPVCMALVALTPSPDALNDHILLLCDYTWNRLAGENGTKLDSPEKRQYAKCLLIALEPRPRGLSFYIRSHRGDALTILDNQITNGETLGGRKIQIQDFNINLCKHWLDNCDKAHGIACEPEFTPELSRIRLIEIESRTVITYPSSPCRYAALSYRWGGTKQTNFQLGDSIGTLPTTIEDAMTCAQKLGFAYFWVDSICIEQTNETHKAEQIDCMWSIYRGSSLTIFALSAPNADTGLPGFRSDQSFQPQIEVDINGTTYVGLMPTLSQYIWSGPWGSRAWTLQEALLSHRCLYISDHQLYYECEVVQNCESLDESRSWAHSITPDMCPDPVHWLTWVMEQNGFGCLRNLLDTPTDRLLHWGQKVTLYSYRDMTEPSDALRAFDGVLQRLQTMYQKGFFWGLPLEDFQWGLLWQSMWPPRRRQGFPTWCWAAWQAGILTPWPADKKNPHRSPVSFRVWTSKGGSLTCIFDAKATYNETDQGAKDTLLTTKQVEQVFNIARFQDVD
ncbi:Heterokaryon incompatibility [Moelleriella libera RCEF 2490]|uniref:Heterokaryon incompatibility n=1 Tax=Moelleriella libera RCEF 2490 TaxID=1081109 RepID=A0A167WW85_9HYPO|nr:Heterokaryon incompatibility [Moelleriella libera RCEF 2490]